jgi:hypothetical protein
MLTLFYLTRIIGVGFIYFPCSLAISPVFTISVAIQMLATFYSCYLLI